MTRPVKHVATRACVVFVLGILVVSLAGVLPGTRTARAAGAVIHLTPCCDPTSGTPKSKVTVKGSGFGSAEQVVIDFDATQVGSATTSSGAFQTKVIVPATAQPGVHTISAHGLSSGLTASAPFIVRTTWEGMGYLPQGGRFNPYENTVNAGNAAQLALDWSLSTASAVASSPAEVHNIIYEATSAGTLYAVTDATGGIVWNVSIGSTTTSSPEVEDQIIYIGADDGLLRALSATAGALLWSGATGGAIDSAPVDAENLSGTVKAMMIVGSTDGKLYAFDSFGCGTGVTSCSPLWAGITGGAIHSSPAVSGGVVYVGSDDGKLYAFNVNGCGGLSCAPTWTAATGAAIRSYPAVANGVVYVSSTDGKLYAFKAGGCGSATCAPIWVSAINGALHSSPAVANGVVYVGSDDGKLYAFKAGGCGAAACAPVWTGATGGALHSSPAVANGVIYVGSDDGKLYAFKVGCASGGGSCSPIWSASLGGPVESSPAMANGSVYAGANSNTLYAFHLPGATP